MNSLDDKIKSDKFALIYEFNTDSPLFCRVASEQLQQGNPEKAIEILENGLTKYPYYPTALVTYALTLAVIGKKEKARNSIKLLSGLYNCESTVNYYLAKIESIQSSGNPDEKDELEIAEPDENTEPETKLFSSDPIISFSESEGQQDDEDLEELAEKLNKAKIPFIDGTTPPDANVIEDDDFHFPGKSLVSETLAKIYFNQGNYKEALSIYETLIDIQPEMKDHYQNLIDQIKKQMKEK